MTKKLFGTDGIRGNVGSPPLWPENVSKLGSILGSLVKNHSNYSLMAPAEKCCIIIGRDTRSSGVYLEHALIAGILSSGVDCEVIGIVPTPAVAFYTKQSKSKLGVMISASHNPYHDNGLKIFDARGFKISEALENEIEHHYFLAHERASIRAGVPGTLTYRDSAFFDYRNALTSVTENVTLHGLKIVVDCAHGAGFQLAADIFKQHGCTVISIGASPDGHNINRGFGSEYPDTIKQEVIRHQADLGIAFDGDADRVIFIDEKGESIDGEAVLALMARALHRSHRLVKNTLVTTVMSSIALDQALLPYGINVVRTLVGDKFVARKMMEEGFSFGGENSGHIINFPLSTTGDGILSALTFVTILHQAQVRASRLVDFFKPTPKLLKNIEVKVKVPLTDLPQTQAAIEKANHYLKNLGRVLLRYSGTENKIRLLVEAQTTHDCQQIANEIIRKLSDEMNLLGQP